MSICKNAIISCASCRGMCDHPFNMEQCPRAQMDEYGFPTFEKAIEIYKRGPFGALRKKNIENSIKLVLSSIGVPMSATTISVKYEDFQRFIDAYKNSGKSDYYIMSLLSAVGSLRSSKIRPLYKECGFRTPLFDFPEFRPSKRAVVITSDRQDIDIINWMARLRDDALNHKSIRVRRQSRNLYLALFFQRHYAMRNGDINRLKWGMIHKETEGMILRYRPHKTPYKESDIKIGTRRFIEIEPFFGEPDDYVITRESFRGSPKLNDDGTKSTGSGAYKDTHSSLWRAINKKLRSFGVGSDGNCKVSYQNRRRRISEAFKHGGFAESCAIGMNTPNTQNTSYLKQASYRGD